ncbi:YfaZ family outer membrane protein [Martelella radicis]|uniref:Opacity protein-like surface antigen n=1 Tax=Martelella radicis TaxID=1397476 RepID=A0A7W6KKL1_9HYPH|nr:YfaZ family outer membrane protein [Martelella radicis]MBB4122760.1 opacity protein-like surface antigen [Martelella radicis]
MRASAVTLLFAGFATASLSSAAFAADPVAPQPTPAIPAPADDWSFALTPYIWGAGLSGKVSPFTGAPTVRVDRSFSEILEELNLAGFVNFYATNGTFGAYADVMYVDTREAHATGPVTLPGIGPVPGVNVNLDTKLFNAALFGTYRLADTDRFALDALAGIRVFKAWADVSAGITGTPNAYRAKSDFGWVDPAIGARMEYDFGKGFSFVGQADIGGSSGGSDLTWQAMGAVKYDVSKTTALSLGYKYLSVDYDRDGHLLDIDMQGPTLGLTFKF